LIFLVIWILIFILFKEFHPFFGFLAIFLFFFFMIRDTIKVNRRLCNRDFRRQSPKK